MRRSEGHEDAPLGIVVEERRGEGIAQRQTCTVRIVQGGNQHVRAWWSLADRAANDPWAL